MSEGGYRESEPTCEGHPPAAVLARLGQIHQSWLDSLTPFCAVRWAIMLQLLLLYMVRVYTLQGWYVVTYALGVYLLSQFIAFLSPKVDPALLDEDQYPSLPTRQNEEFRPFIRRLPEFTFWHSATIATLVAMVCTCFEAFNLMADWPVLVGYFVMLVYITMKRQIMHMIRYRYLPFTHGKMTYQERTSRLRAFMKGNG